MSLHTLAYPHEYTLKINVKCFSNKEKNTVAQKLHRMVYFLNACLLDANLHVLFKYFLKKIVIGFPKKHLFQYHSCGMLFNRAGTIFVLFRMTHVLFG